MLVSSTLQLKQKNITAVNGQPFDATQSVFEGGLATINSTGSTLPEISTFYRPNFIISIIWPNPNHHFIIENVKGAILIGIIAVSTIYVILNPAALATVNP